MAILTIQATNDTDGVDTYLLSGNPTVNYSTNTYIDIGKKSSNGWYNHSLIYWDLSSIPPASLINSVVISLYIYANDANGANTYEVLRCLRDWVEAQATWNIWKTSNNWATAGAVTNASDCDLTLMGTSVSVAVGPAAGTEYTCTFGAYGLQEVKKITDGTYTNYGFAFRQTNEAGLADAHGWCSSGHATQTYHPKIVIDYSPPSSPGLMILGLFRRWKRRTALYRELLAKGAIPLGNRELMPI